MEPRTLVAGIGNIFLGDDGFGVEVVRRLSAMSLPEHVTVADFGIRGVHLAYEMLDGRYERVILVDALPLDAPAGTISVIVPDLVHERVDGPDNQVSADGHAMDPATVLRFLAAIGGRRPDLLVVGCQPSSVDEGIGLTHEVEAAVDEAVRVVVDLVRRVCRVPGDSWTTRRLLA